MREREKEVKDRGRKENIETVWISEKWGKRRGRRKSVYEWVEKGGGREYNGSVCLRERRRKIEQERDRTENIENVNFREK